MLRNYLIVAFRNLLRNKVFSIINIVGLAIAMASSIMIFKYCYYELSYDSFHSNAANIYRVQTDYIRNGEKIFDSAENFSGVGAALKDELPAVEEYARLYNAGAKYNCTFGYQDHKFTESGFYYADDSFLSMFSFPLLAGNIKNALSEPNTAVITESAAKKYFGSINPLGKALTMIDNANHRDACTITAVIKDVPSNSHLKFDVLFSYKTLYVRHGGIDRFENSWGGRDNFYTFIKIQSGVDVDDVSKHFPKIIDKYKPSYTEVDGQGKRIRTNNFGLIALQDIHLESSLKNDPEIGGNTDVVYFLICIGMFILLIAWINYINLATSKALDRAKEVGIRKFLGSSKMELAKQFLLEALIINILSILLAVTIFQLTALVVSEIIGWGSTVSLTSDPVVTSILLAILVVGGILSGVYPAVVLTSFNPWSAIKSSNMHFEQGKFIRKGLVIFQFFISFILIIGTLAVFQQVRFMKSISLGFNPDQLMIVKNPSLKSEGAFRYFDNQVSSLASVVNISASSNIPGRNLETGIVFTRSTEGSLDEARSITIIKTDQQLINTYELNLTTGRNFEMERISEDSTSVILNLAAVKFLDFESAEEAIGQMIYLYGSIQHKVIGIVEDYHHQSAKFEYEPVVFMKSQKPEEYITLKVNTSNLRETISRVNGIWNEAYAEYPFDYFFMNDHFNNQYRSDKQFNAIFGLFSILTLIVSSLGLFGFSLFRVAQRTKEIGIRKALGASVVSIFSTMTSEFIVLILASIVFAIPIAYWLITYWLSNYAFKMDLSTLLFVVPVVVLLFIALLSISIQTIKVSFMSPVDSLRHE